MALCTCCENWEDDVSQKDVPACEGCKWMEFGDKDKFVPQSPCRKCKNRGDDVKCHDCRRNQDLKDNYERETQ